MWGSLDASNIECQKTVWQVTFLGPIQLTLLKLNYPEVTAGFRCPVLGPSSVVPQSDYPKIPSDGSGKCNMLYGSEY